MKINIKTLQELSMSIDVTNPQDEATIAMYRKYRHVLLSHTGYSIIGCTLENATQDKLLENHILLSAIQKARATVPVVAKGKETFLKYSVLLREGKVMLSDFNDEQNGVIFARQDLDSQLTDTLNFDAELTLYLYKSPIPARDQSENMSLLYQVFGDIKNIVVFASHHSVLGEAFVSETEVKLSVPSPHVLDVVLSDAKEQAVSEISALF